MRFMPLMRAMRVFPSFIPGLLAIVAAAALCTSSLQAQQTLGGMTGEVQTPRAV